MRVRRITFKDYAGGYIKGTADVPLPTSMLHIDRVYYLTAMLEAPKYGSVQSYDGAGMSGGPMHNIAVYPRNKKQGSMFPLLRAIEWSATESEAVETLWASYASVGWFVARDGRLRDINTGALISGRAILQEFTPDKGCVPVKGPKWDKARLWCILHHKVFSDPKTFHAQKEFAIEYLLRTQRAYEAQFYKSMSPHTLRVWSENEQTQDVTGAEYSNHLTLEEDLAMCTYHSHSVNGPAPARTVLSTVLKKYQRGKDFARYLIWSLGTKKFGRWVTHRYPRTRSKALQSGLWPRNFFVGKEAIMPRSLPSRRPV